MSPHTGTISDYNPLRLATAYHLTVNGGPTRTVGIVDAFGDPTLVSDLLAFDQQFGLPSCTTGNGCLTILNQNGNTSPLPSLPRAAAGWQYETSLDVQMVHALCQSCHIVLVQASSDSLNDLLAADDAAVAAGATIITNSWGGSEFPSETALDSHFSSHSGVSFLFSTGDDAYAGGVQYPAASQYVTAVGGTTLNVTGSNTRSSETAWYNPPGGGFDEQGAGSGCSAYEPKPAWQADSSCLHRMTADISADADPNTGVAIYVSSITDGASFWLLGGTSLASPIVAAMYAELNVPAVSQYGAWPYSHSHGLFDVTVGSTAGSLGSCAPSYFCTAGSGYDGPTGMGSLNPAMITGVSPSLTIVGRSVTITGTGFSFVTGVKFNGVSATFTVNSDTQISTTVPVGATSGYITLSGSSGSPSSPNAFDVVQAPTITSVLPAFALPGASVSILGTDFLTATHVLFNGVPAANYFIEDDRLIVAVVPAGATDGPISITNLAGTGSSGTFFVVNTPSIAGYTLYAPAGATVSITGSGFMGTGNVTFNGIAAQFTTDSDTHITATVPSNATTGVIRVRNSAGTGTSAGPFTVIVAPTVTGFSPARAGPGETVTITGTNFYAGLGATSAVTIGRVSATFVVVSDTQIQVTIPLAALTGPISVANAAGSASSAADLWVNRLPSINHLSPVPGTSTSIFISGSSFTGTTSVTFNGTPAVSFTVQSDSRILAVVPSGMTSGTVAVTTPAGTDTETMTFPVLSAAPTITSLSVTTGSALTAVTITGTGFTGTTSVTFNGAHATFRVISDTTIVAVVPRAATTGAVVVTTPAGSVTGPTFTIP